MRALLARAAGPPVHSLYLHRLGADQDLAVAGLVGGIHEPLVAALGQRAVHFLGNQAPQFTSPSLIVGGLGGTRFEHS